MINTNTFQESNPNTRNKGTGCRIRRDGCYPEWCHGGYNPGGVATRRGQRAASNLTTMESRSRKLIQLATGNLSNLNLAKEARGAQMNFTMMKDEDNKTVKLTELIKDR
ncbi:hypothetical protein MSG28_006028 [Choristoneura fumiferana]|uniref:Uncharacterized protein n=1 Tax=Choristoneura fumiferana TaxID=7141 RepID=A0ACC0L1T5_CHOFU|nr:hypothetical protein MSG28_006028 [Choristoneura fumiferana]